MTARLKGKKLAHFPHALSDFASYSLGRLPKPMTGFRAPPLSWGMLGNDTKGDCVPAGGAHELMANNRLFHEHDQQPTEAAVVRQYLELTGGADTGLVMADFMREWSRIEMFGINKIAGYAPIRGVNLVGLQTAICYYGGALIGVQLPESAQTQFDEDKPWTYAAGSPNEGGHCIYLCGYDSTFFKAVTWGRLIDVSPMFLHHYLDEAWCVISQELVEAQKDSLGVDLKTLQDDLAKV